MAAGEAGTPALSGFDGGGFQNVVAIDPARSGLVLAGGDVSGFHRSTDWGATWSPANRGLTTAAQLRVASIAFSPSVPGRVYAAVGGQQGGGGLLVSENGGSSWTVRSPVPTFAAGNNKGGPLPALHPRSTGNLLVVDVDRAFIYAATFRDGVLRSGDDGHTWETIGLDGTHLRSIALSSAGDLFAAAYGDGVFVLRAGAEGAGFTRLGASPRFTEELLALGDRLYSAAGPEGVFASVDGGLRWARLGPETIRDDGPVWLSLAGAVDRSGARVVYAGAHQPARGGGGHDSVVRSADGGATWSSLTAEADRIHPEIGGPGGPRWWLAASQPALMLNGGSYTASQIAVDPGDPGRMLVAGRSGVWATTDSGTNWYPAVRGLGATINRSVVADPNRAGRVYVGNTDWVVLTSDDGLAHVSQTRPPGGTMAFSLALDVATAPSTVYAAVGDRDTNSAGEVYSNPDPLSRDWTSEGLGQATGGKRPLGLAVRRVDGAPIILAAVEDSGTWRKSGGVWTLVDAGAMRAQRSKGASFAWLPASPVVFLYDRETGVWRSDDDGRSWVLLWAKPSPIESTGYVAADPTDPSRLFVSAGDAGLFRLDGAATGTVGSGIDPVRLGPFQRPGPIAVTADGRVFVAELPAGGPPGLFASADRGEHWASIGGDTYPATGGFPFAVSAGPAGLYVSFNGNGAWRAAEW